MLYLSCFLLGVASPFITFFVWKVWIEPPNLMLYDKDGWPVNGG